MKVRDMMTKKYLCCVNANITGKMKKNLDFFFLLCYLCNEMKINSYGEYYGFS